MQHNTRRILAHADLVRPAVRAVALRLKLEEEARGEQGVREQTWDEYVETQKNQREAS